MVFVITRRMQDKKNQRVVEWGISIDMDKQMEIAQKKEMVTNREIGAGIKPYLLQIHRNQMTLRSNHLQ